MTDELPFDYRALGVFSKRFADAILPALSEFQPRITMIRSGETDGLSLKIVVPSPSLDADRSVEIWVDEVSTPSIGFGPSHTHGGPDDAGISEIVDLCRAILSDQWLIIEDVGGDHDGHAGWIDMREPDALMEELTNRYSPGRAILKSWSGRADREVGLESL